MIRPPHLTLTLLLLAGTLLVAPQVMGSGQVPQSSTSMPLFHIGKNTNLNKVQYAANVVTGTCTFDEAAPIDVFWRRHRKEGEVRAPLKWVETKFAYGVHYQARTTDHVVFTISADDSRAVVVELSGSSQDNCTVAPRVQILNEWVAPERAFTRIKERRMMFPKVLHVDLYGTRPDTTPICERVLERGKIGVPCPEQALRAPASD